MLSDAPEDADEIMAACALIVDVPELPPNMFRVPAVIKLPAPEVIPAPVVEIFKPPFAVTLFAIFMLPPLLLRESKPELAPPIATFVPSDMVPVELNVKLLMEDGVVPTVSVALPWVMVTKPPLIARVAIAGPRLTLRLPVLKALAPVLLMMPEPLVLRVKVPLAVIALASVILPPPLLVSSVRNPELTPPILTELEVVILPAAVIAKALIEDAGVPIITEEAPWDRVTSPDDVPSVTVFVPKLRDIGPVLNNPGAETLVVPVPVTESVIAPLAVAPPGKLILPFVDVRDKLPVPPAPMVNDEDADILPAEVKAREETEAAGVPIASVPVPCAIDSWPLDSFKIAAAPILIEIDPVLLTEPDPVAL